MKRKIAAIFAADIAGYSRLVAEDEEETLRRLASYRSVMDDFIARAGGRIFNTAGDAVLAEFPSAVEAVRCAIDIQESLRTRNLAYPSSRQMSFRIGITIGDVVERDGDLLGDGVNIAARLGGSRRSAVFAFHALCTSRWRTSSRCDSPTSASSRSRISRRPFMPTRWRCGRTTGGSRHRWRGSRRRRRRNGVDHGNRHSRGRRARDRRGGDGLSGHVAQPIAANRHPANGDSDHGRTDNSRGRSRANRAAR